MLTYSALFSFPQGAVITWLEHTSVLYTHGLNSGMGNYLGRIT